MPYQDFTMKDPLSFNTISYPRDISNDPLMENGHWMIFYINAQNKSKYTYRGADGTIVGGTVYKTEDVMATRTVNEKEEEYKVGTKTSISEGGSSGLQASYRADIINQGGTGSIDLSNSVPLSQYHPALMPQYNAGQSWSTINPTTTRITDSVAIYLPSNIKSDVAAKYNASDMGAVGMMAASGGAFAKQLGRQDYESAVREIMGGLGEMVKDRAATLGGEVVDTVMGSEGSADFLAKTFGAATNPYMEVLFEQMGERHFTYTFSFQPRNQDETNDVHAIIKMFRFHMAPELKGGRDRFLTLPSTFDIHYMYQNTPSSSAENTYYNKIATCVLESCNVDYAPEGLTSFQSGAPTAITMELQFMETQLLTKEMIDAGY